MTSPNYSDPREPLQKTFAMIKPEFMCYREEILQCLYNAGFKIVETKIVKLTPEQASDIFADQYMEPDYALRMMGMADGPVQVLCLSKPQAIKEFLALVGPDTVMSKEAKRKWPGCLRAQFADANMMGRKLGIHGSVDAVHARKEIEYFFPNGMRLSLKNSMYNKIS